MVPEGMRVSAFGILSGVVSAAFVGGTLAARLLSTAHIFQVFSISSVYSYFFSNGN